ncbi:FadR/GntR family transcriptional regulator [Agromyces sp. SYSU T0242]|uniref:FadR/GntR family transcriptional regulator n=1 Tax=Agromyces litoreus TaxID=3158561 RepID=UPI00339096DD
MTDAKLRRQGAPSQTDVVVEGIRAMLLSGELVPGARLPIERDLAERLQVSRGPLREGVRALCMMGVLTTRQGDGTYVTSLDPSLLLAPMSFLVEMQAPGGARQLQAVRRVLESEAVAQAALRMDDDAFAEADRALADAAELLAADSSDHSAFMEADIAFHRVIAAASGNPVLGGLIEALAGRTIRARMWRAIREEGAEARTHADHVEILAAIRRRDPDAARIRMAAHLLGVEDFLGGHDAATAAGSDSAAEAAAGSGERSAAPAQ